MASVAWASSGGCDRGTADFCDPEAGVEWIASGAACFTEILHQ
jgi:hypothetical protein